jgi:hypothetical protein
MDELADIVQLRHETVEVPEESDPGEMELYHMVSWEALHLGYYFCNLSGEECPCLDQMNIRVVTEQHGL